MRHNRMGMIQVIIIELKINEIYSITQNQQIHDNQPDLR